MDQGGGKNKGEVEGGKILIKTYSMWKKKSIFNFKMLEQWVVKVFLENFYTMWKMHFKQIETDMYYVSMALKQH